MLVYKKTMFGRYYCIEPFCHLKTLEKRFEKFIFVLLSWHAEHKGFVGIEKDCARAPNVTILRSFLCTLLLMTSIFVTAWNAYM